MAIINLYKIDENKITAFEQDLRACGFPKTKEKTLTKTINGEEYEFIFTLFLERPSRSEAELPWGWVLDEFDEPPIEKWKPPKAILYIHETRDDSEAFYAVTFGSSFFKVDKYCDRNFGFEFAKRMKYAAIKTTTLTTPNSKRNKTVNTYIDYNEWDFDSGESFLKIKVNAKLDNDFTLFKPALEIGHSIRFNTDINSNEGITDIILYIETDVLNRSVNYKIPLFSAVKDSDELNELDKKLDTALTSYILNNDGSSSLSVAELTIVGASEVFNSNDNEVEIRYSGIKKHDVLSLEALRVFCRDNNLTAIEQLNKIKIRFFRDGESVATHPLKDIIEFTDDERKCVFSGGKWYMYNSDYLSYLNDSIAEIDVVYNAGYDFNSSTHNDFIDRKYDEEKGDEAYNGMSENDIKDCLKDKYYAERCFNLMREAEDKFICYDREDTAQLNYEKMDLYEPDTQTMFAVKIGNSSAHLCYAVDQSLTSLTKYKHGEADGMPKISKVGLWLILERKRHLPETDGKVNLQSLKMLMLKNRIDQWKKEVRLAGFTPVIYVNYRPDAK